MRLTVEDVSDGVLEVRLIVNPFCAAAFRPPFLSHGSLGNSTVLLFAQSTGAPGFQLAYHGVWGGACGDNNVYVIRAYIDRMKVPTTVITMGGDRFFDDSALLDIESAFRFSHPELGTGLALEIRYLNVEGTRIDPATVVTGQPRSVACPSDEVGEWFGHSLFPC